MCLISVRSNIIPSLSYIFRLSTEENEFRFCAEDIQILHNYDLFCNKFVDLFLQYILIIA